MHRVHFNDEENHNYDDLPTCFSMLSSDQNHDSLDIEDVVFRESSNVASLCAMEESRLGESLFALSSYTPEKLVNAMPKCYNEGTIVCDDFTMLCDSLQASPLLMPSKSSSIIPPYIDINAAISKLDKLERKDCVLYSGSMEEKKRASSVSPTCDSTLPVEECMSKFTSFITSGCSWNCVMETIQECIRSADVTCERSDKGTLMCTTLFMNQPLVFRISLIVGNDSTPEATTFIVEVTRLAGCAVGFSVLYRAIQGSIKERKTDMFNKTVEQATTSACPIKCMQLIADLLC